MSCIKRRKVQDFIAGCYDSRSNPTALPLISSAVQISIHPSWPGQVSVQHITTYIADNTSMWSGIAR